MQIFRKKLPPLNNPRPRIAHSIGIFTFHPYILENMFFSPTQQNLIVRRTKASRPEWKAKTTAKRALPDNLTRQTAATVDECTSIVGGCSSVVGVRSYIDRCTKKVKRRLQEFVIFLSFWTFVSEKMPNFVHHYIYKEKRSHEVRRTQRKL